MNRTDFHHQAERLRLIAELLLSIDTYALLAYLSRNNPDPVEPLTNAQLRRLAVDLQPACTTAKRCSNGRLR